MAPIGIYMYIWHFTFSVYCTCYSQYNWYFLWHFLFSSRICLRKLHFWKDTINARELSIFLMVLIALINGIKLHYIYLYIFFLKCINFRRNLPFSKIKKFIQTLNFNLIDCWWLYATGKQFMHFQYGNTLTRIIEYVLL